MKHIFFVKSKESYGGGVFLSTNNGASWSAADTGLTDIVVYSFCISGTNIFAGTNGRGVWKRPSILLNQLETE